MEKNKELELKEENLKLREKELELKIQLFESRKPKVKIVKKSMKRRTVARWFAFFLSISAIAPIILPYIQPELFKQYYYLIGAQLIMLLYLHWLASGKFKSWMNSLQSWYKKGMERAKEHEAERKKTV